MPAPPYSGGKIIPRKPSLPSSLMVAIGKSPASSHVMTLGLISRSANSRTLFFNCSCSSFSWKSKVPLPDHWFFESQLIVGEICQRALTDHPVCTTVQTQRCVAQLRNHERRGTK